MKKAKVKIKENAWLAAFLSVAATLAYYFIYHLILEKTLPYNALFFYSQGFEISVLLCSVFLATFVFLKVLRPLRIKKKVIIFIIVLLFVPCLFFRTGTLANDEGIAKIRFYNSIAEEYKYEDIEKTTVSYYGGLQYDIRFKNGKEITILQRENKFLNSFYTDENLMRFDILCKTGEREILPLGYSWEMAAKNFETEDAYQYFGEVFKGGK